MKSFVGTNVKAIWDGNEKIGMVSSVRGDKIIITISSGESIEAPLDDADISKSTPEELEQGIEYIVEW